MRKSPLVIVIRPSRGAARLAGWLRRLLPSALLFITPAEIPTAADAIVIEDAAELGPLAVARQIAEKLGS
jgi:hypothetical protein